MGNLKPTLIANDRGTFPSSLVRAGAPSVTFLALSFKDTSEGGDLLVYILKHDGLGEAQSRFITYQLCDALAYIHGQGAAHRDLKPEVRVPSRVSNAMPVLTSRAECSPYKG